MADKPASTKDASKFSKADKSKLKKLIDEIDALVLQQGEIGAQKKEAIAAAEAAGFSKKRIADVLKKRKLRRKQTAQALEDAQIEFDFYWEASGGDNFEDALEDDDFAEEPSPRGRGLN